MQPVAAGGAPRESSRAKLATLDVQAVLPVALCRRLQDLFPRNTARARQATNEMGQDVKRALRPSTNKFPALMSVKTVQLATTSPTKLRLATAAYVITDHTQLATSRPHFANHVA